MFGMLEMAKPERSAPKCVEKLVQELVQGTRRAPRFKN